jgi:hypothetical protein
VVNKKVADNLVRDRRQSLHAEYQVVSDFDQHTGRHFLKSPHYAHSFRECFQVMKADFNAIAIDDLFGSPGNGNAGPRRSHYHDISSRALFQSSRFAAASKIVILGAHMMMELVLCIGSDRHRKIKTHPAIDVAHLLRDTAYFPEK